MSRTFGIKIHGSASKGLVTKGLITISMPPGGSFLLQRSKLEFPATMVTPKNNFANLSD